MENSRHNRCTWTSLCEVICVQERPDLAPGVYHASAPAQHRIGRLECRGCACSTGGVDLSRICGDSYGGPIPVPGIPGSLPLLVFWKSRQRGKTIAGSVRRDHNPNKTRIAFFSGSSYSV